MVLERGDIVSAAKNHVYNAVTPTGSEPIYVVGNPVKVYDNSSVINLNEEAYEIPAGQNFRVYPLAKGDRFAVADYSIDGSAIAVGDTIGLTAGSRLLAKGGTTTAFEGKVVKVDMQGAEYFVGQKVDTRINLITIEVIANG